MANPSRSIPNAPATAAASSGRTPASASAASVSHPSAARSGSGPTDRERRAVAAHQATASAAIICLEHAAIGFVAGEVSMAVYVLSAVTLGGATISLSSPAVLDAPEEAPCA